jgi:hypothetical protein
MTKPFAQTKFIGKQHNHGCTRCRRRYWDACQDPNTASLCNSCVTGRVSAWARGGEPAACCTTANVRPADRTDRERYLLAGQGPWFLCKTCARQFPCPPEKVTRS